MTVSKEDAHKNYSYDGYQSTEQEAVIKLLNMGFIDAFRFLHPKTKNVYTWWSGKNRKDNRGRRLDYFLVSKTLVPSIRTSSVMMETYGSDHCPIALSMRLHIPDSFLWSGADDTVILSPVAELEDCERQEVLPNAPQIIRNIFAERLQRSSYAAVWNNIDWEDVERRVAKMQKRLAIEALHGGKDVRHIQQEIISSIDARLLAVRHVCSANSIPGVDDIKWRAASEKMNAAIDLVHDSDYKAQPSRIIVVQSKNGKVRHIHINTWYDRAMQTLYAMALDPIAEALADRTSFAFRRGRSHLDLQFYLERGFEKMDWAFVADVKQCYESISHDWIEKNIPLDKKILHEFISAGYIFEGRLYQPEDGVGIGMNISPIIANMVLDGLKEFIGKKFLDATRKASMKMSKDEVRDYNELLDYNEWRKSASSTGEVFRYADDIIVLTRTREEAEMARNYLVEFLEPRGLELSPEKSRVVNVREGFDFMSRTYVKKHGRVFSYPSETAVALFMKDLKDTVLNHKGSQLSLIKILNAKLTGWATYHKIGDAQNTFGKIDIYLKALLLEACETKHPQWTREKIFEKYWYKDQCGVFHYALPYKREIQVKSLESVCFVPHKGVWLKVNPYVHKDYLNWRTHTRSIRTISGPYKVIWDRQKGRCYYCGCLILPDQERVIVSTSEPIDVFAETPLLHFATRTGRVKGVAYAHLKCVKRSVEFLSADVQPESNIELMNLLKRLNKYKALSEFFKKSTTPSVVLNFSEVEDMLKSIALPSKWWRDDSVRRCWVDNGYEVEKVDMTAKKIRLKRTENEMSNLEIPEVFLTRKIPNEAKYELENYMKYVIKKYELV